MNIALVIIWIIVIILLISLSTTSYLAINAWIQKTTVTVPSLIVKCEPAFNTLPDITTLQCCSNNLSTKYISNINMVVSNFPSSYLQACSGFCTSGVDINNDAICIGGLGQTAYNSCLKLAQPNGCVGKENPVAHIGAIYYYPFSATNQNCTTTVAC
jgi:hypothetical protein